MIKYIVKSRYLKTAALATAALMILLSVCGRMYAVSMDLDDKEKEALERNGVKIEIPFGRYDEIRLIDSQRPIAAVKVFSKQWKLIDLETNNEVVLEGFTSFAGQGEGLIFMGKDNDTMQVIDAAETMATGLVSYPFGDTDYDSARYDGNGLIWLHHAADMTVCDMDGNVVYETEGADEWMGEKPGYAEGGSEKDGIYIKNIRTGVIEHRLKPYQNVESYMAGHWVIATQDSLEKVLSPITYHVLDNDYNMVEKAGNFTCYLGNEEYLYIQKDFPEDIVIDKNGETVLSNEGEENRIGFNGACKDIMFIDGKERGVLTYIKIRDGKAINTEEHNMICLLDFDDGMAAAAVENHGRTPVLEDVQKEGSSNGYKFGFVDSAYNEITGFIFDKAWESRNGYAVVMKGTRYGLIDMKGAVEK